MALRESAQIRKVITDIATDAANEATSSAFRVYKAVVTSPANVTTATMGVRRTGDTTVMDLPYTPSVASAKVGDVVWIATVNNSWLNAIVWMPEDFSISASGGGGSAIAIFG